MSNPFDFEPDFSRIAVTMMVFAMVWLLFMVGAIGTGLWLAGRALGAW